jgi:hypothetical protein
MGAGERRRAAPNPSIGALHARQMTRVNVRNRTGGYIRGLKRVHGRQEKGNKN